MSTEKEPQEHVCIFCCDEHKICTLVEEHNEWQNKYLDEISSSVGNKCSSCNIKDKRIGILEMQIKLKEEIDKEKEQYIKDKLYQLIEMKTYPQGNNLTINRFIEQILEIVFPKGAETKEE